MDLFNDLILILTWELTFLDQKSKYLVFRNQNSMMYFSVCRLSCPIHIWRNASQTLILFIYVMFQLPNAIQTGLEPGALKYLQDYLASANCQLSWYPLSHPAIIFIRSGVFPLCVNFYSYNLIPLWTSMEGVFTRLLPITWMIYGRSVHYKQYS